MINWRTLKQRISSGPPRWEFVRATNLLVMIMCAILALNTYPSWVALLDAFLGGAAFGLAVWITVGAIPMRRQFDEMSAITEKVLDQNVELLDELQKHDTWRGLNGEEFHIRLH